MKKATISLILTTLLLASCMPDSLTKYKKEENKKAGSTTSTDDGDGSSGSDGSGSSGTTSQPTTLTCENSETHRLYKDIAITPLEVTTNATGNVTYTITTTGGAALSLPAGLSISSSTGTISGTPTTAKALTTYRIKQTYTPNGATKTCNIKISVATKLNSDDLIIPHVDNQSLILELDLADDMERFSFVTAAQGPGEDEAFGFVNFVDGENIYVNYSDDQIDDNHVEALSSGFPTIIEFATEDANSFPSIGLVSVCNDGTTTCQDFEYDSSTSTSLTSTLSTLAAAYDDDGDDVYRKAPSTPPTDGYTGGIFRVGAKVDTAIGYDAEVTEIKKVTYVFKNDINLVNTGDATDIELTPQFVDTTGYIRDDMTQEYTDGLLTFSVFPAITAAPSNLCNSSIPANGKLYFSKKTGQICAKKNSTTGKLDTLASKEYTVSVVNANSESFSYKFNLIIEEAPADLSSGELLLLTVNSTSAFKRAQQISAQICATTAEENIEPRAVVKEIVNATQMLVKITQGTFDLSLCNLYNYKRSIDNKAPYSNETTKVTSISAATFSLLADDADVLACEIGKTVEAYDGLTKVGTAVIVGAEDFIGETVGTNAGIYDTANMGKYYLQLVSGYFKSGDTMTSSAVGACPAQTISIDQIDAPNIIVTTSANIVDGDIYRGADITSTNPANDIDVPYAGLNASGTLTKFDAANDDLYIENYFDLYETAETISKTNPYSVDFGGTISSVRTDQHYNLYLGEQVFIKLNLKSGNNIKFELDKRLPEGLDISPTLLAIVGIPTDILQTGEREEYTVRAYNAVGSTSHTFTIQIHNHFTLGYDVDATTTSRYVMHMAKFGNKARGCRITEDMIDVYKNDPADLSTVIQDCFLDAGETELFNKGVTLASTVGGGLCDRIVYEPFSFFRYRAGTSLTSEIAGGVTSRYGFTGFDSSTTNTQTEACYIKITYDTTGFPNGCSDPAGGSGSIENNTYYIDEDCNGEWDPATEQTLATSGPVCHYDYSSNSLIAKNCDEGSKKTTTYNFLLDTVADDACEPADDTFTRVIIAEQCNGIHESCMAGPAADIFTSVSSLKAKANVSISTFDNPNGQNFTYHRWNEVIPPARNNRYLSNASIANYTSANQCVVSDYEYDSDTWIYDSRAKTDVLIDPFHDANPAYVFRCEDDAGTTLARFNLYIREFDVSFSLTDDIDTFLQPSITANVVDDLSPYRVDTTFDPANGNQSYNDRNNWEDFLLLEPASCVPDSDQYYSFPGLSL